MEYPQDVKEAVVRSALAQEMTQDAIAQRQAGLVLHGRRPARQLRGLHRPHRGRAPLPLRGLGERGRAAAWPRAVQGCTE